MRIRVQFKNGTYSAKVDGSSHSATCTAGAHQAASRAAEKAFGAAVGSLQVKLVGGTTETSFYHAALPIVEPQNVKAIKSFDQLFDEVFRG